MVDSRVAAKEVIPTKITIEPEGAHFKIKVDYPASSWEKRQGSLEEALAWVGAFVESGS